MTTFADYEIEEINYNMKYAPLGEEEEFQQRIINDVIDIISRLNTNATLGAKVNEKIMKNNYYLGYVIEDILDKFCELEDTDYKVYDKCYYIEKRQPAIWSTLKSNCIKLTNDADIWSKKIKVNNHRELIKEKFLNYWDKENLIKECLI